MNPSVTTTFIEKHITRSWGWGTGGISSNVNITPIFIEKHIESPWDWGRYGLSDNPSVPPEFIEKHIARSWCWGRFGGISRNTFCNSNYSISRIISNVKFKFGDQYDRLVELNESVRKVGSAPPNAWDLPKKPVFSIGGYLFRETLNQINDVNE
jgi:hypothetical protein